MDVQPEATCKHVNTVSSAVDIFVASWQNSFDVAQAYIVEAEHCWSKRTNSDEFNINCTYDELIPKESNKVIYYFITEQIIGSWLHIEHDIDNWGDILNIAAQFIFKIFVPELWLKGGLNEKNIYFKSQIKKKTKSTPNTLYIITVKN